LYAAKTELINAALTVGVPSTLYDDDCVSRAASARVCV